MATLTGKTIGELSLLQFPTNDTLIPVEYLGDTLHITFSSITYNEGTYSQFVSEADNGLLTTGRFYLISDFQTIYDQPNFDSQGNPITVGNNKSGSTESLLLLAISTSQFAPQVYSLDYPKDFIKYDISVNVTEVTNTPAKGRITERIDERNNRADYDFRAVQFIRYEGYLSDNIYSGTISMDGTDIVTGTDTNFTNDFNTGNIFGVFNANYGNIGSFLFYEILSINSDTEMSVTGTTLINTYGQQLQYSRGNSFETDYPSPFQNNVISDNGSEEYYTFNEDCSNNYLGNHVNINEYNNPFYLSNNVFVGNESDYRNNTFGINVVGNTFVSYENDFEGNTCGMNFQYNILDYEFSNNNIGSYCEKNVFNCYFNENNIGENFSSNMIADGDDFENNVINSSFRNNWITDDVHNNVIGDYFNDNIIHRNFYHNNCVGHISNNIFYGNFEKNIIGYNFNNNVFSNRTDLGSYYVTDNTFGSNFNNNNIDHNFTNNQIGTDYYNNVIKYEFSNNSLLNNFYENSIYNTFQKNSILNGFNGNTIGDSGNIGNNAFENNSIMNEFKGNNIQGDFWSNQIKSEFKGNETYGEFKYNNIGFGCGPNIFSGYTTMYNTIGDYFYFNTFSGSFAYNVIGTGFVENEIEDGFGYGGSVARGNRIGNNFYNNIIGEYFYDNVIQDNFTNNTIIDYFQLNDVKVNGLNNIIFSGVQGSVDSISIFQNATSSDTGYTQYFVSQTSTDGSGYGATFSFYVSSSTITNLVIILSGNDYSIGDKITISADQFQGLEDLILTVDDLLNPTPTPIVYTTANSTIFKNSDGVDRLSYFDGSDVLTITNINE